MGCLFFCFPARGDDFVKKRSGIAFRNLHYGKNTGRLSFFSEAAIMAAVIFVAISGKV